MLTGSGMEFFIVPHPTASRAPSQCSSGSKLLFLHKNLRSVPFCMKRPKASLELWEKVGRLAEAGAMLTPRLGAHTPSLPAVMRVRAGYVTLPCHHHLLLPGLMYERRYRKIYS